MRRAGTESLDFFLRISAEQHRYSSNAGRYEDAGLEYNCDHDSKRTTFLPSYFRAGKSKRAGR